MALLGKSTGPQKAGLLLSDTEDHRSNSSIGWFGCSGNRTGGSFGHERRKNGLSPALNAIVRESYIREKELFSTFLSEPTYSPGKSWTSPWSKGPISSDSCFS